MNPRIVFQRMFGDGATAAERMAQVREDRSILDWVTGDIARLQQTLGPADRSSVAEYLDSVREVERRIQNAERHDDDRLDLPERPVGVPETYDAHARLMFDLLALAFQADSTRVFVFTLGKEQTNRAYPELGVNEAHHAVSHHQNDPIKFEKAAKINTHQIQLLTHFLSKLKATPEGDSNLLDHSLVLHGGGISDANEHSHIDLPLVLVGGAGGLKGGRILRHSKDTPMNTQLMAMLERVGVNTDKFGDATAASARAAVGTVLATFMGGLAAGAAIGKPDRAAPDPRARSAHLRGHRVRDRAVCRRIPIRAAGAGAPFRARLW